MLTANDLADRPTVNRQTICKWHRSGVLPAAISIGRTLRWRDEDIVEWENFLQARVEARRDGIDPDSPEGPAPPVYSTGCESFDGRKVKAQREETERRAQSRARREKTPKTQPVTYED